jgi:UDP-N-acetylmuramoyl-tripeptide--D-alanyl-D-alanine ligase
MISNPPVIPGGFFYCYFCTMTIDALYDLYRQYPGMTTDTRKIKKDDLFFALKGPNFDGNQFIQQAFDAGAAWCVADDPQLAGRDHVVVVPDVLESLQQLAQYHRRQFHIPFIGITGSNGKTTTKELVHAVLSSTYITYTTEGNLNNHIGIPLTILKVQPDAEMAVIEMGANHQQEIAGYCVYAQPTHGIITNCGKAHLEGFGGAAGVRKGKGELYDHLRTTGGTAFVMWDYDYLQEMSHDIKEVFRYGSSGADLNGRVLQSQPFLEVGIESATGLLRLHTQLVGDYNLPNVLAAVAVGRYFKIADEKIKDAIEAYRPYNSRSQLKKMGSNTIILDAYNANPSSMKLAIENFSRQPGTNKILMLGAMAELGDESLQEHQAIVDLIGKYPWKAVVLAGGDFLNLTHPFIAVKNAEEAGQWWKKENPQNSQVLVKGSRSMQMEKSLPSE